jgi:hypothetical protein
VCWRKAFFGGKKVFSGMIASERIASGYIGKMENEG